MTTRARTRRPRLVAIVTATALCLSTGTVSLEGQTPQGETLPVRQVSLDNGMRLLILPTGGAPTVSFVVRFDVGGVHEQLGTTGTAHLLEHMLFKGTTSIGTTDVAAERALFRLMDAAHDSLLTARGAEDSTRVAALRERIGILEDSARVFVESNEFDRVLTQAGARDLNATTTSEATTYYVQLPANRAELWFALEADRMANPVFREFYAERDVVTEERRMRVETSPAGLLYEAHMAAAFTLHPYGVPVVGYMSDLEALSRDDVESYYRRFYGPNNAVVAVVGGIDPDLVERWARRYLAPIPAGESPAPVLAREPEQRGERRVVVEWDAEPRLRIGWHVPPSLHEDAPAIAVLSSLLTGGRTSRLHRRLVLEERIATGVFSSTGPGSRYPQLFQLEATPRSPHTPAEVEAAIYEEIERMAESGPTPDELTRVRNRISAGSVRRLQSNLGLAFQLVESVSLMDDWRETFRSADRLRTVTVDDVQRVAARYFSRGNRTVATLMRSEGS